MSGIFLLRSSDGMEFRVERDVMALSKTLDRMIQDLGLEEFTVTPIPLPNVDSPTLEKVLKWCRHHKDDEEPEVMKISHSKHYGCIVPEWDKRFLAIEKEELLKIAMAADYLNIPKLLNYGCKSITKHLQRETAKQIRRASRMFHNWTEEQLAAIKADTSWFTK